MGTEFELKYRAVPEQIAAIRDAFGPFREISMETTYYDAPDRSLSARKWTLRRRLENGVSICTLKTPGTGDVRGEWETECGTISDAIDELCKLGAPAALAELTAAGLVEVCGARFTRLACLIGDAGCKVELALDQGVLLGGGREIPLCEVEAELKEGSETAAVAFAKGLADKFGLVPETASKFKRALGLAENQK
ncbi:MAG: CYTH domain-containing protein [Oscillospiraceae bacterium]|nr:CYTH domain-containing protein [Oscillospiraceae bacterium]